MWDEVSCHSSSHQLLAFGTFFCVTGCFSLALIGIASEPIRRAANAASASLQKMRASLQSVLCARSPPAVNRPAENPLNLA
jgi:hypothetical protein